MSNRDANLILRERAIRLAQAEGENEVSATEPYVAFMVSGQCFGVSLKSVLYAGRLRHLTPLPGGASYLLGITVLAGHLVSVLDIAGFLSLRQQGLGDVTCCLVVESGERELGLCAEQLIGIEDVPVSRIMSIAASSSTVVISRAAFLDRFRLLIIDLDRLLADPRLSGTGDAHG